MKLRNTLSILALTGIAMAQTAGLVIPPDQPICRLYSLIQLFGTIGGILLASYAGLILSTSHDLSERNNAKAYIGGVIIGLSIIWLSPWLINYLVGGASICGW